MQRNILGASGTAQPDAGSVIKKCKERGDSVVELDNFKSTLQGYKAPLQEVRDSL